MKQYKGIACTMLSAALFGLSPILAKFIYAGGANSLTLVFLRGVLSLPVLLCIMRAMHIPLGITKRQLGQILLIGSVGSSMTTILLYAAYNYISVGLATTLHYTYPIVVVLVYALLYRQKPGGLKIAALILGLLGVGVMMLEPAKPGSMLGIALGMLSGVFYCIYLIGMDRTGLKSMHPFKLTFYISLTAGLTSFVFAAVSGNLQFPKTSQAWLLTVLLSLMITIGGFTLLQLGLVYTDTTTVSIVYTVEPITSVLMGAAILHESLTVRIAIGTVLILASVILVALADRPPRSRSRDKTAVS